MAAVDKKGIREEIRLRLRAMDEAERKRASRRIFEALESLEEFRAATVAGVYMSLADEPDAQEFVDRWRGLKRIVVPRVEGDGMVFCDYDPELMRCGAFGIREPAADAAVCPPADIDFLAVPAVAYTRDGRRLGRGGGFYDRYMSQPSFRAFTAGVCFGVQLVGDIPVEPHDISVEKVVSDL